MPSALGPWLIERRGVRIALVAVLLPLFGVMSAAIVVAIALVKGWRTGLIDSLIALIVVLALATMSGTAGWQVLLSGASTWGVALLMGGLMGVFGSLTLAIQVVIALCCVAVLGFALLVSDPVGFWGPILQVIVAQMQAISVELTNEAAIMGLVPFMSGLFVAGTIVSSIAALLLGCWLAGGATSVDYRGQFLGMRLGYVIGGIAAVAGIGSLLGLQPLAGNVLLVAAVGFLFQGIAVVHWHVATRRLSWFLLIPVYLPALMGPGFLVMLLFLFAAVGFIDNWYGLRRAKTI